MPVTVNLDAVLTGLVFTLGGAIGGGGFWLGVVSTKVTSLINWKKAVEETDREDAKATTDLRVAISELRGEIKGFTAALSSIFAADWADKAEAIAQARAAPPYEPRPPRRRGG